MKKYRLLKPHKFFNDTKPKGLILPLDNSTGQDLVKQGIAEEFGVMKKKKIVSEPKPKK